MSQTGHTPTPYRVVEMCKVAGPDGLVTLYAIEAEAKNAAHTPIRIAEYLRKQNAAFIVRACNAHDKLVKALLAYVEQEEQAAPSSSSPLRENARAILDEIHAQADHAAAVQQLAQKQ
ncbi:MAG: hypothetical protein LLG01_00815 [Planctomycetaceae bacterium]|nr:hypothetical protein [Planctomycetaceae bacterium]